MNIILALLFLLGTVLSTKVNVMLPLDTVKSDGTLDQNVVNRFSILKNAGVYGVMVDVWWGICEPNPSQYNFGGYQALADACNSHGLKLQVVMSFHQCGGSVGDNVTILLPAWVRENPDIWYQDQNGHKEYVYVSLAHDDEPCLRGRTPIQAYSDYMKAFKSAMGSRMGAVVNEIQVGCGPCGELRYTGYIEGLWSFPGIGQFQCFSTKMKTMFKSATAAAGHAEWDSPPTDAGSYKSRPDETSFFRTGYTSEYGKFFMNWYSNLLIEHARRVLTPAVQIFKTPVIDVAMKVAGIHWWYNHASHAAEMTTGYANGNGVTQPDFYRRVGALLKELGVVLDFTCFEMSNNEQDSAAGCSPEGLVAQILGVSNDYGLTMSSENALARYDATAYNRIINNACNKGTKVDAFTYLRLNDNLVYNNNNLNEFKRLVSSLARC